jgi:hypothetical protein
MTDNANPQDLIALLRTFIGDTQIVRAAREAADVIEQQAARIAEMEKDVERYRWLKSMREDFDLMGRHSYYATELWNVLGRMPDWDATIDAAIAASEPKNTGN